jgi:hypothetical protein
VLPVPALADAVNSRGTHDCVGCATPQRCSTRVASLHCCVLPSARRAPAAAWSRRAACSTW